MKNLMLAFAALALLFTACRKDEDVTDIDLQIPPGEEVVKIDALGIVTDIEGNTLPGTVVQLFTREGALIGEATTNAEGRFEIPGLTAPTSVLLVFAGKENYHSTARMVTSSGGTIEEIHLKLASNATVPGEASFSPGDSTFIVVQGTIIDNSSLPVPAFAITFVNGSPYHVAVADDEGIFEVFAPYGESFDLVLYQACGGAFYNEALGPFFADQVLDDFTAPEVSFFLLNGTLLDCDGNPVTNGYALIDWSEGVSSQALTGPDGFFSTILLDCQSINPVIKVTGYDLDAGTLSDPVDVPFNSANMDAGTLTVCDPDESNLTFDLDGTSYTFQPFLAFVVEDSITDPNTGQTVPGEVTKLVYQSTDGLNSAIIDVHAATTGTFDVQGLFLVLDGQPIAGVSTDPAFFNVTATFDVHDNVPNGTVEGSFGGTFVDFTGQRSINGTFKARQQ